MKEKKNSTDKQTGSTKKTNSKTNATTKSKQADEKKTTNSTNITKQDTASKKNTTKKPTEAKTPKVDSNKKVNTANQSKEKPIDSKEIVLETHDFTNDSLTLKAKIKKNCRVLLHATINENLTKIAEKKALKSIKKEISIPGFRKGKAPENLIRDQYAKALSDRTEKELVDITFFESIKLSRYTPFDPKKSKFLGYSKDKKSLDFEIESYPKMPDIDYKTFKLPTIEKKEVDESSYQEAITKLKNMYAEQVDITDRGVKEGDFILVDVEDLDSPKAEKVFSNTRFEVAKGKISEWMNEAVLGKKVKETIETVSKPDSSATEDEKKEFKEKKVRITINQIQEMKLPALDDELAKKYQFSTKQQLEEAVKQTLKTKFEKDLHKEMRQEIGKQLKAIEFEIPASILEQESNHRITQMFSDNKFKLQWSKMSDNEKEAKKNVVIKDAKESLVLMFITQKIIAENKLKIHEPKESTTPNPLEMAIDFDPMMFFKPSTAEQKNIDYSMRTIQTAQDFIIKKLENKS